MANDSGLVRVNFSLRGFAKCVNLDTLSKMTPDRRSLVAFGYLLSGLELDNDEPVSFPSIPEFRGLDYVGYVIEKERLDKSNGSWIRLEEFKIMGSGANSFKDSRIAYGETYRYRIRCVAKFTTPSDDAKLAKTEQVKKLADLIQAEIDTITQQNANLIQNVTRPLMTTKTSTGTVKAVDLGNNTQLSIGLTGQPTLSFKNLSVAEKDRLNALQGARDQIQKALAVSRTIPDSVLKATFEGLKQQGYNFQDILSGYSSQYYVGPPTKNWQYIVVSEQVLPPAPETMKVVPNSLDQSISLYWLPPANSQRDTKHFNVYRRNDLSDPWALIAEKMPLNSGSFIDRNVDFSGKYIYALSTVDVHGYESFLSTQVEARLNSKFRFEKSELPLRWVSGGGARKDEVNTIFKKFYPFPDNIVAQESITISAAKKYAGVVDTLYVNIKSLDTHETKEVPVTVLNSHILLDD